MVRKYKYDESLPVETDSPPEFIGILADRRTGKTNMLTAILYDEYQKGIPIVANYPIYFPHTHLSFFNLVKMMKNDEHAKKLQGAVIGLDELSEGADAYQFWTKESVELSKFVSQLGKLKARVIYTDQRLNKVAKRLRDQTDIFILLTKTGVKGIADFVVLDAHGNEISQGRFDGRSVWNKYDTWKLVHKKESEIAL